MLEYLENPRRAFRARLRCRTRVTLASGAVYTTTEDVGARGCQIVVPEPVAVGVVLRLELEAPKVQDLLEVDGRVAWVSPRSPWRAGIAFVDGDLRRAADWMDRVRASLPELFARHHAPPRVALQAIVYLGQPPRLPDFSDEDLSLLRQVGSGLRVRDVRCTSAQDLRMLQQRFFALLEQGYLTLFAESASHPRNWKAILGEPTFFPGVTTPLAPAAAAPAPVQPIELPPEPEPAPAAAPTPAPTRARPDPAAHAGAPAPDFEGKGVGWRTAGRARPPDAEELYRKGLAELEAGRPSSALALLRQAISVAPGDSEIAGAIGRAMRGGK